MFGTLKPQSCSLNEGGKEEYARFYCGLCKTLGDNYDTPTRALLSHDAVFLALLADGLLDAAGEESSCRCPMMPVVHRPTIAPSSAGLRYAAGVQMLLADQLLADRAMDGRKLYQGARSLLGGRVRKARGLLVGLGVDLDSLDGFERRQARCEIQGETSAEEAAEPTAAALAVVFGRLVELPGAGYKLRSGASRRTLAALGRSVGRVIYFVDALEDLKKDLLGRAFNPCLRQAAAGPEIDPDKVKECIRLLQADLAELRRTLADLPFRRHRRLVENILIGQLGGQASSAIRLARGWSTAAGRRHLAARRATSLPARTREAFLFALAFVWTTLLALPASFAQNRPKLPIGPGKKGLEQAGGAHGQAMQEAADAGLSGLLDGGAGHSGHGGHGALLDGGLDASCDGGFDAGLDGKCPDDLDASTILDGGTGSGGGGFGSIECPCTSVCNSTAHCLEKMGGCFAGLGKCIEGCGQSTGGCLKGCADCPKSCDPSKAKCCDCNSCLHQCCDGPCKACDPSHCSSPCQGCDCGSCCKGCDTGGCCNSCSGCGNSCNGCGSGCNGCGSGCNSCGSGCNGCNCH